MSAVIDNLTSVIENQRIKINEKQVDFLDDLTKQFLKDFILKCDYTNTREAALYGIIFPKDYSHDVITTRQKYDISCPFLHQIEFLINGNENSKLDINFNFLQPIIQKPGTKSSMRDPNTGQEYKKGVRDTISQQVSCSVTLNEILSDTKIHNFNFNENSQEIKIWKDGTQQDDNERPLFTVKRISHHVLGNISISSLKITDSLYKITVKIENLTPIELGESKDLRQKEVWKYAFFGAHTEIKISEGNPISFNENDPSLKLPLKSCTSLNTITKLSSSSENKIFTSDQMVDYVFELVKNYPIFSIEDALSEDDWDGWKILTQKLKNKVQIVGDDLFVTNIERLKKGINNNIANSILVKLNQIGTLSETLAIINTAKENNKTVIIGNMEELVYIIDLLNVILYNFRRYEYITIIYYLV